MEDREVLDPEKRLDPREPGGREGGAPLLRQEAAQDGSGRVDSGTAVPQDPEYREADDGVDGYGDEGPDEGHKRCRVTGAGQVYFG
jgi:hypothetical protein